MHFAFFLTQFPPPPPPPQLPLNRQSCQENALGGVPTMRRAIWVQPQEGEALYIEVLLGNNDML